MALLKSMMWIVVTIFVSAEILAGDSYDTLESGTLPAKWATWEPNCDEMPEFHIYPYNENFYILRQSGCLNFEKPFLYLIFGSKKAILFDTGAAETSKVAETIMSIVEELSTRNGKTNVELVVAHTHSHPDHIAGDRQFKQLNNVVLLSVSRTSVKEHFGITQWPEQIVSYDLGDRVLDIIPIPGHDTNSIAVYDRRTGILLTGDSLYPGRLYINYGLDLFTRSTQRMVDFTKNKLVTHVLGSHIENTSTPYKEYMIATKHQPEEHVLELGRAHLLELLDVLQAMEGKLHPTHLRDFTICKGYPNC